MYIKDTLLDKSSKYWKKKKRKKKKKKKPVHSNRLKMAAKLREPNYNSAFLQILHRSWLQLGPLMEDKRP